MKDWREKGWCEWEQGGTLIFMGVIQSSKISWDKRADFAGRVMVAVEKEVAEVGG